jgi:hypothetical protein
MREALADRMMIKVISSLPPCREVPCGLEAKVECSQLLPMIKTKGIGDDRALVKFGGVVLEKKFHAETPGALSFSAASA